MDQCNTRFHYNFVATALEKLSALLCPLEKLFFRWYSEAHDQHLFRWGLVAGKVQAVDFFELQSSSMATDRIIDIRLATFFHKTKF